MAEAVAAVGLASNIISFVDFAAHLLEIGSQIRKKDLKDPPSDPQLIMRSLESISSKVNNKKVATCHTEDEKILNDITDDCIAIAKDLVTDIRDITKTINKVDQAGNKPAQVAQSIAAAIKIHRGRPRMEKLSAKLDQHRHLLGTSVLVLIQNKVDAALDGIRFATYQSQEAHERTTSTLSTLINNTTGSQETLLEIKEGIQSIKDLLKSNTIYPPVPRVFTDLDPSLKSAALHGHAQVERKFLSWLHFPIMVARKKAVNPASLDTFLWIFKEDTGDKNNFASWLVRGAGIYWISGKAGCGKSTLMKLLMDRPETVSCLETWAGTDHSLVRPSCFFWAAGSDLQRCQEGLLRTLLHTILKHRPDLTAQLFPERYEAILNE